MCRKFIETTVLSNAFLCNFKFFFNFCNLNCVYLQDLAGNSRMYVHSSIAMTRSPSQFPAPAAPGAKNVLKIPPGLPRPTTKNSLKRKANEAASKPLMQMNNQRVDDSLAGTTSSGSYGEFVVSRF